MTSFKSESTACENGFKILRLRFLRPPPEWIAIDSTAKRNGSIPIDLALGITDDYGSHVSSLDPIQVRLDAVHALTHEVLHEPTIAVEGSELATQIILDTARGPFYTIRINLNFTKLSPNFGKFALRLSLDSAAAVNGLNRVSTLSRNTLDMLNTIGEAAQEPADGWDDVTKFVFMSAVSGPIEIKRSGKTEKGATSSNTKVQTILRTCYLLNSDSEAEPGMQIFTVERPNLNNSTGQRLWDCAIGLTCFLAQNPRRLYPTNEFYADTKSSDLPTVKRLKTGHESLRVIELGAGCASASIAADTLLSEFTEGALNFEVIATDIEATVNSTLRENLDYNGKSRIRAEILEWGKINSERAKNLVGEKECALTLLLADVLYDPDSHTVLLETIQSLFWGRKGSARALVAYKPRTDGDDNFFAMAAAKGSRLKVEKVWHWGELSIWSLNPT